MEQPYKTAVVLLAAGAASRMRGGDKLLEPVGGRPLLRHLAKAALDSAAAETVVVLGANAVDRRNTIKGLSVRIVVNNDWRDGMSASIRAGIAVPGPEIGGALILPGDMPAVTADIINRIIAGFDPQRGRDIVRPFSAGGTPGHPVLFGRRHFPALAALSGDTGGKPVIADNKTAVSDVPFSDDAVLLDLDTPEDWQGWRAGITRDNFE